MADRPSESESISLNHAREQTLEADVSNAQISTEYKISNFLLLITLEHTVLER